MDGFRRPTYPPPQCLKETLVVPEKLLMGPGPSNCSQRVLDACSLPILGHMHKEFFVLLDEIRAGLQYAFQTRNKWTICISGPGHLGMEAVLCNLLEEGESIVVGVNGLWGGRAAETASRLGAVVHKIEKPFGTLFSLKELSDALERYRPKVLFLVHSESSTGVMQNLNGVGDLCRSYNCLLVVDTVASLEIKRLKIAKSFIKDWNLFRKVKNIEIHLGKFLYSCKGGVPVFIDDWKIDAVYTGSQKVLGAPPGIAPISFSPRAVDKIKNRRTPIKSYLCDMNLLANYWGCNEGETRVYHHTPPVNLLYGLREGLAMVAEEGLENLWRRHAECVGRLYAGLRSMGLEFFVEKEANRLPTVTTLRIPPGCDWKLIPQYAMDKYRIEIAGGLGPTLGMVLRIGVMGHNAYPEKVDRVLNALKEAIQYSRFQNRL